ncbi:MAG: tetratricopeptide repeat protein [Pseudomonadota bacterium]
MITAFNNPNRNPSLCMALLVMMVGLGGCSDAPLPELPDLKLASFDTDVATDIQSAEAAVLKQPENPERNGNLARLLHTYGQDEWAAACYMRARALSEDDFELAYLHAIVLARLGDRESAVNAFEQANELRDDYAPALLRLAALKIELGDNEAARALYERILDIEPGTSQALLGLAGLTETVPEATSLLEQAADLRRPFGKAHYALATAYRKQGRTGEADEQLRYFERYKKREPALADPVLEKMSFLNKSKRGQMNRALALLGRGNNEAAAIFFESVLRKDPGHVPAYSFLIVAYGNLGDYARAAQRYETAVERGDVSAQLHVNMGVLELTRERYRDAAALFRTALEVDERYALAHVYLGAALEAIGDSDTALAHYATAVALDPDNRQAGHSLANLKRKRRDYAGALEQFERIVEWDDAQTPVYLRDMATVYERLDQPSRALAALDRASRLAVHFELPELATALERKRNILRTKVATP